jgi:hypothetical protein
LSIFLAKKKKKSTTTTTTIKHHSSHTNKIPNTEFDCQKKKKKKKQTNKQKNCLNTKTHKTYNPKRHTITKIREPNLKGYLVSAFGVGILV